LYHFSIQFSPRASANFWTTTWGSSAAFFLLCQSNRHKLVHCSHATFQPVWHLLNSSKYCCRTEIFRIRICWFSGQFLPHVVCTELDMGRPLLFKYLAMIELYPFWNRFQPTSMSLSLWPGPSWSFEDERFRNKNRPGKQFHRRWGSEGLLCPGIPSGCSWCLCRQFGERFCSLLMLILCISRFSNLVDCELSGWIAFWLELILCGMMWYACYAFYWDIGMILAGSACLCQRHLPWIQWELLFGNSESKTESCVSFVFHDVSQMSTLVYFHVAFPLARH
jgi:hypothetical protein